MPEPPIMPFITGGFFHINSSHVLTEEQFFFQWANRGREKQRQQQIFQCERTTVRNV